MSSTIDERVVEMRFDNKQFESGVKESLSTLDRLKQALNLSDSAKGLENVQKAADGLNMNGVGKAVDQVKEKFSAFEGIALGALARIGQQAIDAGEKITKALTIEPISQGFSEYELKMGSVQTIMASTGESLDTVNRYLEELNTYADKTIYSFSDMTSSIGKFTNAGVSLEDAVKAIQGISNEAAVSGANAEQASHAMYNFAQALSAGAVKLIDWKSIENANMATVEFKQTLLDTAVAMGTVVKVGDEYQSTTTDAKGKVSELFTTTSKFNESLSSQWMTTEVLVQTLNNYSTDVRTLTEAEKAEYEEKLRGIGYTEEQIKSIEELGQKAFDSAQDVKTFTQLFDTLKEAAGSGWAQTWEIIIGDFEKAKERLTELSDVFGEIIGGSADRRNTILEGAFTSKWDILTEKLNKAGIETETFQNKVTELAKSHNVDLGKMIEEEGSFEKALQKAFNSDILDKSILKDAINSFVGTITDATESTEEMAVSMEEYGEVVDKVIRGDFGNGEERIKALTEAGYDYATVQDLVNEKLGSSVRHLSSLTEEQLKNADSLAKLSDEELKNNGYTEEQIVALRDLQKEANTAGSSIDELINDFEKPSGAELVWGSVLNVLHSIVDAISAVKKAWNDIFHAGMTEDEILAERSEKLYNLVEAIHSFTEKLKVNDETAEKITRTFKGLFAILDVIRSVVSGGVNLAFKVLSTVLDSFDMNILDVTANIGDLLVAFRDFIFKNELVEKGIRLISDVLKSAYDAVKRWIDSFTSIPTVQKYIEKFNEVFRDSSTIIEHAKIAVDSISKAFQSARDTVEKWIDSFMQLPVIQENISNLRTAFSTTFDNLREYVRGGIEQIKAFIERVKALDGITLDNIGSILEDFRDNVVDYFLNIGGKFDDLGNAIRKFRDDVQEYFSGVSEKLEGVKKKLFDFVESIREKFSGNIGLGEILTVGLGAAIILLSKKIGDALSTLAGPLGSLTDMVSSVNKVLGSLSKAIKAAALKLTSEAMRNAAVSIAILSASIVALAKSVDSQTLWDIVKALGAMAGELTLVTGAIAALSKVIGKSGSLPMLGIASSMLILVGSLKAMESLDAGAVQNNIKVLAVLAVGLAAVAAVLGRIAPELSKNSLTLISIAAALKILVSAVSDIDNLQLGNINQTLEILMVSMLGLSMVAAASEKIKFSSGAAILAIVVSLKILVSAIEDIANLDSSTIMGNLEAFIDVFGILALLMLSTKLAGEHAGKAGVAILAISTALIPMAGALKLISMMDYSEIAKATDTVNELMGFFAVLIAVSHFAGKNAAKAGAMLLMISGAITILGVVIIAISQIKSEDGIKRATIVVDSLMGFFALIIAASGLAKDCKGTITAISVTIGLLAIAIGALSMINADNVTAASNALTKVMAMFALLVVSTSLADKATVTIIAMTGAATALSGMLYILAGLPVESSLAASESLSMLLLSFSASMLIVSRAGDISTQTIKGLAAMTAVTAGIALILGIIAGLNIEPSIGTAASISTVLLAISAAMVIVGKANEMSTQTQTGLAVMTAVTAGIAVILGLMTGLNVEPSIETAASISTLLLAMSAACVILSKVGPTAQAGMAGIQVLSSLCTAIGAFVIVFGAVATGIGALADLYPPLEEFLNKGLGLLGDVATGIGNFAGNIVAGFLEGALSTLPEIGTTLSDFASNVTPFFSTMSSITPEQANSVKTMADAILTLTAANLLSGLSRLTAFFTGGGFSSLSAGLPEFGQAMADYASKMSSFGGDFSIVEKSANAAMALAKLEESIPRTGGKLATLIGDRSWTTFKQGLPEFGQAMADYASKMSSFGGDYSIVEESANAAMALAKLEESIPRTGGKLATLLGDRSWTTFKQGLPELATALAEYATNLSSFNGDYSILENSAAAAHALVDLEASIPRTGGNLATLLGDRSWTTFKQGLPELATALAEYAANLSSFNGDYSILEESATAAQALVDLEDSFPKSGGWFTTWFGEKSWTTFKEGLPEFAQALADYCTNLSSGSFSAELITTSASAAGALSELSENMPDDIGSLSKFGESIKSFGEYLSDYSNNIQNINVPLMGSVISEVNELIALAKNMTGLDVSGMSAFGVALATVATNGIDEFIETFNGSKAEATSAVVDFVNAVTDSFKSKETEFENVGQLMRTAFLKGLASGKENISSSVEPLTSSAVKAIKDKQSDFDSGGQYVIQGFIRGMSNMSSDVYKAAASVAQRASVAIDNVFKIASPSKETKKKGEYVGQGLIEGFESMFEKVKSSATDLGMAAKDGLEDSINEILKVEDKRGESFMTTFTKIISNALGVQTEGGDSFLSSLTEYTYKAMGIETESGEMSLENLNEYASQMLGVELEGTNASLANIDSYAGQYAISMAEREQVQDESIAAEEAYWAGLYEVTKRGQDAEKYQEMSYSDFKEDVLKQTTEALDNYTESLQSNIDSLMNANNIFAEVQEKDAVESEDLVKNLSDQIDQMAVFNDTITSLNDRLIDGCNLKDVINQMGVDSLPELQALNSMTDDQLTQYVQLYDQKYALCQQAATTQLSGLKTETEAKLSELYGGVGVNLDEFISRFDGTFESIKGYVSDAVSIGTDIVRGIAQGMVDSQAAAEVENAAADMVTGAEEAAKEAAQISSPSALFRDEVGKYITEGVAEGMTDSAALESVRKSSEEVNTSAIDSFTKDKEKFKTAGSDMIGSYVEGIKSGSINCTDSISTTLTGMQTSISGSKIKFQNEGSNIMVSFISGIKDKDSEIMQTITEIITKILTEIRNKYEEFNTVGKELIDKLISGANSKDTDVTNAFSTTVNNAVTAIREMYTDFHDAGSYLVDGFCAGISENDYKAAAKAKAMADAAASAAAKELDESSPSKVGYRIGDFFGIAFVDAIGDYKDKSFRAGSEMADSARTGLSKAVSKVADIVENGIDAEPTIRPVLDLSNVENGARTVSSMFGGLNVSASYDQALSTGYGFADRTLGEENAISDLISRMEKSNIAGNGDVVDAVNQLRGDVTDLSSVLGRLKIVMDTGAVVGALSPEIDLALGKVSEFRKRRM